MEIEFAFLADAADSPQNGKLYVLGAGLSELMAHHVPIQHPTMSVVVCLKVHPTECNRTHRLEVEMWDEDGNRLPPSLNAEFVAQRHPQYPNRPTFVQLVWNILGLELQQVGEYEFHIIVNGQHLRTLPLYVSVPPPQQLTLAP